MPTPAPPTTIDWLDLVKTKIGARTDSQLAGALCIKPQTVSQQRKGKHKQQPLQALRTARVLGLSPMAVIAAACCESSTKESDKIEWAAVYRQTSGETV